MIRESQHVTPPTTAKSGFSLVELSIVLVILGLLVGGVLTGQSLIRAAELRSVTTDLEKYKTATYTFRDKYFALPGDMPNATSFWGSMTNCGAASPSGTGTQTCNGDGDGMIEAGAASQTGESFGFWKRLANAGLIEGTYTGITGSASVSDADPGINVPASKLGNSSGFGVYTHGSVTGNSYMFDGNYGSGFKFGRCSNWDCIEGTISAEEMWNIDTKIDDGKPGTGLVVTRSNDATSGHPSCVDGSSTQYATANYRLDNTLKNACGFYYRRLF